MECPNEAISMGDEIFEIDADKCTKCADHYDEPSCILVCPVECIVADPKRQESLDQLANEFTQLHG